MTPPIIFLSCFLLSAWLFRRLVEMLTRPPPPISRPAVPRRPAPPPPQKSSPPLLSVPESDLQCPCCLTVPRSSPVPSCPSGHIVCTSCYNRLDNNCPKCPTCRAKMTGNNFSIAGSLIHRIRHSCEFSSEGCAVKAPLGEIDQHEARCRYRTLLCLCQKYVPLIRLSDHSTKCFFVYDGEEGVMGSWRIITSQQNRVRKMRPIVLTQDGHRFYVHFWRMADEKRSIFYTAMEGGEETRKKYKISYLLKAPGTEDMEVVTLSDVVPARVMFDVDKVVESGSYGSVTDKVMKRFCHVLANGDEKFILHIRPVK